MSGPFKDNLFQIQIQSQGSQDGISSDGLVTTACTVFVYQAGTKTLATLYKDGLRTSLANPITRSQFATDGMAKFYTAEATVDIYVNHSSGFEVAEASVAPTRHTLVLNTAAITRHLVFPMIFNSGGTEVDTGIDLPLDCIVTDARVEVVTSDSSETVDIGLLSSETAGDADGFIAAVSVASTGYPALVTYTTGSNETYLSATKYGALLGSFVIGADVVGDAGNAVKQGHIVTGSNAKSVSYTPSSSDTFAGYGHLYFQMLR